MIVYSFCFLVILHMNHSFPSHFSPVSPPFFNLLHIHLSEKVRPPMGCQKGLALSVEAGPISFPLHWGWAWHPTIWNGIQKHSPCTMHRSWSHYQGFDKSPVWVSCLCGFPIIILMPLAHIIPPSSLQLDSQSSGWHLAVDLWICFHHSRMILFWHS